VKFFYLLVLLSSWASAQDEKLLDKIVGVVNSRVVSLSEIKRVHLTMEARKEVSPMVYTEKTYTDQQLLDTLINAYIIRDKINAQGFVINDDAVESRVKMTEERLGLKRADLLAFLKNKGLTYEEYFELIRESMEYNIFAQRIIAPLISVTDQEIKNEYYRRNSGNNTLSFKYNLVDFYIAERVLVEKDEDRFIEVLRDYQLTGKLPEEYREMETNNLDGIGEDSLSGDLAKLLKDTPEGSFSNTISLNGYIHAFYVQKKDLVESISYSKMKEKIQQEIFMQKGGAVTKNWFDREYGNYYIKQLL
jgi:peptidyl-prolyl cis-trans isomerase SurA